MEGFVSAPSVSVGDTVGSRGAVLQPAVAAAAVSVVAAARRQDHGHGDQDNTGNAKITFKKEPV